MELQKNTHILTLNCNYYNNLFWKTSKIFKLFLIALIVYMYKKTSYILTTVGCFVKSEIKRKHFKKNTYVKKAIVK